MIVVFAIEYRRVPVMTANIKDSIQVLIAMYQISSVGLVKYGWVQTTLHIMYYLLLLVDSE